MYRRPNAPFKPPRPLSTQGAKIEVNAPSQELFVPEEQAPKAIETRPSSNRANQNKGHRPLKRLKLEIKRDNPGSSPPTSTDTCSPECLSTLSGSNSRFYAVQWRKRSTKKHKLWEGDGYIVVSSSGATLKIEAKAGVYKIAGRSSNTNTEGLLRFGQYEVEVDHETTKAEIAAKADEPSSSPPKPATHTPITTLIQKKLSTVQADSTPDSSTVLMLPPHEASSARSLQVDPNIAMHLRPHQREGVIFLYECLMGFKSPQFHGALLADEMGLGKTLMTISVIWTFLKQSPFPGHHFVLRKILICCPVTLIDNWRREFKKWIDVNRIGILALNNKQQSASKDKKDVVDFGKTNVYQVLIMSYEKVLACSKEILSSGIDMLVCDEGHRLKSGSNKVLNVLNQLNVRRKLVLTGTPIQNDLLEFFNLINFVNPGILGSQTEFQKNYLRPILRAREVNCFNKQTIKDGKVKSSELINLTKSFILRRTKAVISNYLTTKTDLVVFCRPTSLQKELFHLVSSSTAFDTVLSSESKEVLSMINVFRKICNSPSLLSEDALFNKVVVQNKKANLDFNMSALSSRTTGSKINVLVPLLLEYQKLSEKVILVSNFTQTLDLLEKVVSKLNISFLRLDGTTPLKNRDGLVTTFNKRDTHQVFLLSAKAGGVGLNLIGASRLVLFDNDWNPLIDLQAMARIHRDGQTKPVFIYRLFTTGSIDEKIFQRQLMKSNLSELFIDDNLDSTLDIFTYDDLKDLFSLPQTTCNTHDLLDCECSGVGQICLTQEDQENDPNSTLTDELDILSSGYMSASAYKELDNVQMGKKQSIRSALSQYKHFDPTSFTTEMSCGDKVLDRLLTSMLDDRPTYVFAHVSEKVNA